jgi:flagellar protein FlbD
MIQLTRLNQTSFFLNADLIEHIESTPDTVISLAGGQKYRVAEGADEVVRRVIEYRRRVAGGSGTPREGAPDDGRAAA